MNKQSTFLTLLTGDAMVILLATVSGFSSHATMGEAPDRLWYTWLPFLAGWLLVGPWLGVFDEARRQTARDLWRPLYAMILAAPVGGFLRALWLGSTVIPIFVIAFGGICALALAAWRGGYFWWESRQKNG